MNRPWLIQANGREACSATFGPRHFQPPQPRGGILLLPAEDREFTRLICAETDRIRDLAAAGMDYTLVDDFHFKNAGLKDEQLHGSYLTEDDGQVMTIFPGSHYVTEPDQRRFYTLLLYDDGTYAVWERANSQWRKLSGGNLPVRVWETEELPPAPDVTAGVSRGGVTLRCVGPEYLVSNAHFTVHLSRQGGMIRQWRAGTNLLAEGQDLYGDQDYFSTKRDARMEASSDVESGVRVEPVPERVAIGSRTRSTTFSRFAPTANGARERASVVQPVRGNVHGGRTYSTIRLAVGRSRSANPSSARRIVRSSSSALPTRQRPDADAAVAVPSFITPAASS